jgi:ATP-dependent protease Clp ATPase subunit
LDPPPSSRSEHLRSRRKLSTRSSCCAHRQKFRNVLPRDKKYHSVPKCLQVHICWQKKLKKVLLIVIVNSYLRVETTEALSDYQKPNL